MIDENTTLSQKLLDDNFRKKLLPDFKRNE